MALHPRSGPVGPPPSLLQGPHPWTQRHADRLEHLASHALRHTFITRLARSGVVPAVAKSLARHSTIVLTMDHYTHTLIGDERAALDRLPEIRLRRPTLRTVSATGT